LIILTVILGQAGEFATDQPEFVVNDLPESMKSCVLNYQCLTEAQIKIFLDRLFTPALFGEHCNTFQILAKNAQQFVVKAKIPRVHPSIRDLVRTRDLAIFFNKRGRELFDTSTSACSFWPGEKKFPLMWASFLMAIAINYYFRLPTNFQGYNDVFL